MTTIRRITEAVLPIIEGERRPSESAQDTFYAGQYGSLKRLYNDREELQDHEVRNRVARVERVARGVKAGLVGTVAAGGIGVLIFLQVGRVSFDIGNFQSDECEDMAADDLVELRLVDGDTTVLSEEILCTLGDLTFEMVTNG